MDVETAGLHMAIHSLYSFVLRELGQRVGAEVLRCLCMFVRQVTPKELERLRKLMGELEVPSVDRN